ncbi:BRO family protein [Xylella fastidiosa subsp. multiplex]|uniref:BRO-N domain-containing protein n=1 Tax=Xylella fastidiosa TaxID=2371 RepID=UPI0020169A20|nr:BRO family protein [Xylella fastidiosa]
MSLTTVRRCGTVAAKEPKNSELGGTRTRNPCGFFTPARFYVGRAAAIQHPQGENCPPSEFGFLASRHPQVRRLRTSPLCSSHNSGDIFMSQSIIPFDFHSHVVRVVMRDGNPWFVAKDVMDALDYAATSNPARVTEHIPAEWVCVNRIHTNAGERKALCLAEPGLYFFLGRSDKPKALPFQKWLAGEVLPSIRKTGGYVSNDTVSLTTVRRCGTVAAKELKNSEKAAVSALVSSRFFCARTFLRREGGSDIRPFGESCPPVCFPVLNLPTFSGRRVRTSPRDHLSKAGDVL